MSYVRLFMLQNSMHNIRNTLCVSYGLSLIFRHVQNDELSGTLEVLQNLPLKDLYILPIISFITCYIIFPVNLGAEVEQLHH